MPACPCPRAPRPLQVVLFLFQLEMDSQLQRALTYERFDMAQEVRARRAQVDAALAELQGIKGPGCGARVAARSDQMEYAPQVMTLKAQVGGDAPACGALCTLGRGGWRGQRVCVAGPATTPA